MFSSSEHCRNIVLCSVLIYTYVSFTETLLKLLMGADQFCIWPDTPLTSSNSFEYKVSQSSFTPQGKNS